MYTGKSTLYWYWSTNRNYVAEFESLDYNYLKGLVEGYRSRKKESKKRLYIGKWGWNYFSGGAQLVLALLEDELKLFPHRSWAPEPLLLWLPNGELHVQNFARLCRIRGGQFLYKHLMRQDGFPVKDGDVYLHGVPQPPAALIPLEHLTKLQEKARKLAAYLLPPRSKFYWSVRVEDKAKFRLRPTELPPDGKTAPRYLSHFQREMEAVYVHEGMDFPKSRQWRSEEESTPSSHIEAVLIA